MVAQSAYHPLTLTFRDPSLEREFQHDYFEKSLWHTRGALLLAILLYGAFGILDPWIIPDVKHIAWLIRYALVIPLILAVFAFTFSPAFERWMQPLLAILFLIGSFGIIAMIAITKSPDNHLYYAGMLLAMTFGFTVLRLQFARALVTTLVIVTTYEVSALWLHHTPLILLMNNSFFIVSAIVLGIVGGYNIEIHIRRDFLQRRAADEALERLKALGDIGRAVGSTLDLETVLSTIISRADQVSGTDGGAIYEFDEHDGRLHPRATQGFAPELVQALTVSPLRVGQGIVGRAAQRRQIIVIPDIDTDAELDPRIRALLVNHGFRSALALPLQREAELLGGLVVLRKTAGPFSAQTIDLVQTFATQSAVAIHNARQYREIEAKSVALEIASQHKSDFLAHMSHELRTPLNAVIGFSELLKERTFGELSEKQAEYVEDIHASGRHLLSLINDILDLSKIEAGRMELDLDTFSVARALENAMVLVRERAQRHGVDLALDLSEGVGELCGDERKFKQVMLNLLSNAVKFTPNGGRVSVSASVADGRLSVSVRDTGVGIAPADQAMLFEAFRQVGAVRGRKVEGTGLGLALTRKFIELHGGDIRVESEPGKGSCFSFSVPLARPAAEASSATG